MLSKANPKNTLNYRVFPVLKCYEHIYKLWKFPFTVSKQM